MGGEVLSLFWSEAIVLEETDPPKKERKKRKEKCLIFVLADLLAEIVTKQTILWHFERSVKMLPNGRR